MWLFISIAKTYKRRKGQAPKGIQSLFEPLIIFIRDDIARDSIGEKHYRRFLPYLLTLFFFIFLNNLIGLIPIFPGGANVTGNLGVTGVLAGFTLMTIFINGNKNYWKHIFNTPGMPWWLKIPIPLIPIIEIVGVFTKAFCFDGAFVCQYHCRTHYHLRFYQLDLYFWTEQRCRRLYHICCFCWFGHFYKFPGTAC